MTQIYVFQIKSFPSSTISDYKIPKEKTDSPDNAMLCTNGNLEHPLNASELLVPEDLNDLDDLSSGHDIVLRKNARHNEMKRQIVSLTIFSQKFCSS